MYNVGLIVSFSFSFVVGIIFARDCCATEPLLTKEQQIVLASFAVDVDNVERLLAEGINPNSRLGGSNPKLSMEAMGLDLPIGWQHWTPLLAVSSSDPDVQSDIEGEEIKVDISAREALHSQRDKLRVKITKMLIDSNADVNAEDGYGATALHVAARNGYLEVVQILIRAKAEVDLKARSYIDDVPGKTPVHEAVVYPTILSELIKAGASVNSSDDNGSTPLHYAVRAGNIESVRLLLNAGADPAMTDNGGFSPSHWCTNFELHLDAKWSMDPRLLEVYESARRVLENKPESIRQKEIAKLLQQATQSR